MKNKSLPFLGLALLANPALALAQEPPALTISPELLANMITASQLLQRAIQDVDKMCHTDIVKVDLQTGMQSSSSVTEINWDVAANSAGDVLRLNLVDYEYGYMYDISEVSDRVCQDRAWGQVQDFLANHATQTTIGGTCEISRSVTVGAHTLFTIQLDCDFSESEKLKE